MNNSLLWEGLLYVVLGFIVYFIAGAYGTRIYAAYWKQTHKDPLPADMERGYLVGRTVRGRFPVAYFLSIAIAAILYVSLKPSPVPLIIKALVFIPFTLSIGFFIAGLLKRSGGVERVAGTILDTMESVESGKVKPKDAVSNAVKDGAEKIRTAAHDAGIGISKAVDELGREPAPPIPAPEKSAAKVEAEPEPARPDFNDVLNRFKKGG